MSARPLVRMQTTPLPPGRIVMKFNILSIFRNSIEKSDKYSKTCLKRNAIVPVFFPPVFTGFRFTKGCVLIKQSTKNMIA